MMYAIGIDIGGTATRVGVVASDATLVTVERFDTEKSLAGLRGSIVHAVEAVSRRSVAFESQTLRTGLAIPGLLDADRARILRCVNLPFLEEADPMGLLPRSLRETALVLSDAEAATWGECLARDDARRRFAHLRLGTGVGCGVIVDGATVELERRAGQHADVLVCDSSADAPLCGCGRRGCLEMIASRGALSDLSSEYGLGLPLSGLAHAAAGEDPRALALLDRVSRAIAGVVRAFGTGYDVGVVALGGGVVAAWPVLLERVRKIVGEGGAPVVAGCLLGDDAGVVGAGVRSLRRA